MDEFRRWERFWHARTGNTDGPEFEERNPAVVGAFDPGVNHGIAVLLEDGTMFVYGGRLCGKTKEEYLARHWFASWTGVPEWVVEKPQAPVLFRGGKEVRMSRSSGISLGLIAGTFIGAVTHGASRMKLVFTPPGSWNYKGRGMAAAREFWERKKAEGRIDEHALAYEGTGRFKDVIAAVGILLVRLGGRKGVVNRVIG